MEDEQPVNPEELSPQERLNYLRKAVDEEDALNVLLGLHVMENPEKELDMRSPNDDLTALEYAVTRPTTRPDVRKLLLELLLVKVSASTPTDAYSLLAMAPGDAQEWMYDHGLAIDDDDEEEEDQPAARPQEDVEMADLKPEVKQEEEDVKPKPEPMEDDQSVFGPSPPPPSSSQAGSQISHLPTQPIQADGTQPGSSSTDLPPPPPAESNEPFRQSPSASTRPKPEFDPVKQEPPRGRSRSRSPRSRTRQHSSPPPPRRRTPTPRSSQPPSAATWLHVTNIPQVVSEYHLHKLLMGRGIDVANIRLQVYPHKPCRWAFVGLVSADSKSEALSLLNRPVDHGHVQIATPFRSEHGSSEPGETEQVYPYRGPEVNSQRRRPHNARELVFRHLRPDTPRDLLIDFIEKRVGPRAVNHVRLVYSRDRSELVGFVDFYSQADCRLAIRLCDGFELDGWAIGVTWASENIDIALARSQQNSSSGSRQNPDRSSPSAHEPHLTSSNVQPLGATNRYAAARRCESVSAVAPAPAPAKPASSPSATRNGISSGSPPTVPSRLPSTVPPTTSDLRPPAPVIACAVPEETDLARLRSVNIPESTIASLRKIWAPLEDKGKKNDKLGDGDGDKRTLTIAVEFGFLPQREAKLALDENEREPAYPDEPEKQKRYEAFLKAQAGESKDWYTVFFAKLAEFNATAALFAKKAHELAAASSPRPPPPPP
ncbi:hypothetical protein JCM8097_005908 [Rhodosporidiobolus ruineniae]